jgi:putative adhesin
MKHQIHLFLKTVRWTPALLLAASAACFAATEEKLNQAFPARIDGLVIVDVDFGSITVDTNKSTEVTVEVWRKVSGRTRADEETFLRDNPVIFNREGATVTIRSRKPRANHDSGKRVNQNDARYLIRVPARFNAQLNTSGGNIVVNDLNGEVKADTSGGSLAFARLRGPLRGGTAGGGIEVYDCQGQLRINTSGGGITVADGSGSLTGETSGGDVAVRNFRGPVRVETSGGGITVENVLGRLEGSTAGGAVSAVLPSPLAEAVTLSTSGGSVFVRVPGKAAFDLDARTSVGGVSSDFAVESDGKKDHDRLTGAVNGGGPSVRLRSGSGGIHISKL